MAVSNRGAALAGNQIVLRAVFTDEDACLVDLDVEPSVYIYDESVDTDTIASEAEAATYTSALAGPFTATRLSTGYYEYVYTVPAGGAAGSWHDLWVGTINTQADYEYFSFEVTRGFVASSQSLGANTMVIIELTGDITNTSGDALSATELYYTTTYTPLYASPDMVRLEMGRWVDYVPDDTIALMLHIASKEAQFIQGASATNSQHLQLARAKFVVFDAVWRLINIPGHGLQANQGGGGKKSLGDLSITQGSSEASEIPDGIYEYVQEQRQEWWRVVNAGATIVPGQGLAPQFGVKGFYDPDRRLNGRLWDSPENWHYRQPGANRKLRHSNRRRGRFGFDDHRRRNRWD